MDRLGQLRHSQRKMPTWPMPSTITIMPAMNTMVDQLMPPEDSDAPYQKVLWPKADRFRVSHMAPPSCIQTPNTSTSISAPQPSVTHWRGMRSSTISRNIMTKITNAASSATIGNSPLFRILSLKRRLL